MRINELIRKEAAEGSLDKKSSNKSRDRSSFYDRMKNGLGIASAGALKALTAGLAVQAGLSLDGAHALSTSDTSGTALAHRDGGNATSQRHGLDQGVQQSLESN